MLLKTLYGLNVGFKMISKKRTGHFALENNDNFDLIQFFKST